MAETRLSVNYSIIVATSDEFEDCWEPFFTLLQRYWPNCEYPIILTTQNKTYSHTGLDITCNNMNCSYRSKPPAWSDRLLFALSNHVNTNIILLLLDDFFLIGPVDLTIISKCYNYMKQYDYSCITLTNHDTSRIHYPTSIPLLRRIDDRSPYRITTSPSLWSKSALQRYLRPSENIWMFEKLGTRRSYKNHDLFFRVNEHEITDGFREVIPYFQTEISDTGIVKGKWQVGINELFDKEGIRINYDVRGYYKRLPYLFNKYYIARKLLSDPILLIKELLRSA